MTEKKRRGRPPKAKPHILNQGVGGWHGLSLRQQKAILAVALETCKLLKEYEGMKHPNFDNVMRLAQAWNLINEAFPEMLREENDQDN